ncbi:TonB-dependent receptor domain-containing protein [Caulobacter segnis]
MTYDDYVETTLTNAGPGYIRGIELSAQKDFKELPAPFDGLGVYANASFIDSRVLINVPGRPDSHVPFFNQADKIFNLQAYYERGGFQGRVAYSYQGKATSSSFGVNPDLDTYRDPRKSIDARVSYRFSDGVQIALAGQNLGNPANINRRKQEGFNISSYEVFGREYRLDRSPRPGDPRSPRHPRGLTFEGGRPGSSAFHLSAP